MFAAKFCALSQNVMSVAYLVLKLLQNIVQVEGMVPLLLGLMLMQEFLKVPYQAHYYF